MHRKMVGFLYTLELLIAYISAPAAKILTKKIHNLACSGELCIAGGCDDSAHDAEGGLVPMMGGRPSAGAQSKKAAKQGSAREPSWRWYDARARVALRRVAMWLNVPNLKLVTFECLLAQQAQVRHRTLPLCSEASPWLCTAGSVHAEQMIRL